MRRLGDDVRCVDPKSDPIDSVVSRDHRPVEYDDEVQFGVEGLEGGHFGSRVLADGGGEQGAGSADGKTTRAQGRIGGGGLTGGSIGGLTRGGDLDRRVFGDDPSVGVCG